MNVREIITEINKNHKLDHFDHIDFDLTEGVELQKDEMFAPSEVKDSLRDGEFYKHILYPLKDNDEIFYGVTENHDTETYHVSLYNYSVSGDDQIEYIGEFKI